MNRRNFILGLGTAATLSGAASVTSAALQGSVSPGADFRVISAQQLTVRRNGDIETPDGSNVSATNDGYVNTSASYVDQEGNITFSEDGSTDVYDIAGPNATVDSEENGALNMSLATPNNNETDANRNGTLGGTPYYSDIDETGSSTSGVDILEVENLGSAAADVAIEYGYGISVTEGNISESLVNDLFTFVDSGGNIISPTGSDGTNDSNSVSVGAGDTEGIGLILNYSDSIEQTLRNELEAGFGASGDDLDLLSTVDFGVLSN